ncbi:MAG: cupin domain-containing protein, partial [Thermodesulfobacteriota bacterium]|nr:cupin domain-containing protein [Thermodesulfobacteriota bacterium]
MEGNRDLIKLGTMYTLLNVTNIFENLPINIKAEVFEVFVSTPDIRIERIISKGHTSPDTGWYDQDENEWVIVLEGAGSLAFDGGEEVNLKRGDFINIPKNR